VVNFTILSRYSTEAVKSNVSNRSYNLKVLPPLSIPQIFIGLVSEYYCHENFYAFVIRDIVLRELLVFATGPLIFNRNDLVVILNPYLIVETYVSKNNISSMIVLYAEYKNVILFPCENIAEIDRDSSIISSSDLITNYIKKTRKIDKNEPKNTKTIKYKDDWKCEYCNHLNFQREFQCFKCKSARPQISLSDFTFLEESNDIIYSVRELLMFKIRDSSLVDVKGIILNKSQSDLVDLSKYTPSINEQNYKIQKSDFPCCIYLQDMNTCDYLFLYLSDQVNDCVMTGLIITFTNVHLSNKKSKYLTYLNDKSSIKIEGILIIYAHYYQFLIIDLLRNILIFLHTQELYRGIIFKNYLKKK